MGKSLATKRLLLQREATPGVAVTNAMRRVLGFKSAPGFAVEGESFKASGSKVTTNRVTNSITGAPTAEATFDYNFLTYGLTGGFGAPVSTPVDNSGTPSTVAATHVFTLNGDDEDARASFTAMWGDDDGAVQMPFFTFNGFGFTIGRTSSSVTTSVISGEPLVGQTMPTTGVTDVGTVPVQGRSWRVYVDDSWANLGTTKLLALYEATGSMDGKYVQDYVIDADVPSFKDLIESDDATYTLGFTVGFDAVAQDFVADFKAGQTKFVRLESIGPVIENATTYRATLDYCITITDPGQVGTAPNSPVAVLPFNAELFVDPVTGNVAQAELVNTVMTL